MSPTRYTKDLLDHVIHLLYQYLMNISPIIIEKCRWIKMEAVVFTGPLNGCQAEYVRVPSKQAKKLEKEFKQELQQIAPEA